MIVNPAHPITAGNVAEPSVLFERASRLAAVVLLAGSIRPSDLQRAAGRPILDLPVSPDHTLGHEWSRQIHDFRVAIARGSLPLLVTANNASGTPRDIAGLEGTTIRPDTEEPRGSGGSLRDIAIDLDPQSFLLVASGHSFPRSPLLAVFSSLVRHDDDIVIHTDLDNHPTGTFLIRCGALVGLPARGFVDLKEQALPQLSERFRIRIARDDGLPPIPIRSLHGYISVLRAAAGQSSGGGGASSDGAMPPEDWMCTFNLTEAGSSVDLSVRLHDSVVLSGGRVGARARLVRSLVGPGGIVPAGAEVFDELLPRSEQRK